MKELNEALAPAAAELTKTFFELKYPNGQVPAAAKKELRTEIIETFSHIWTVISHSDLSKESEDQS